MSILSGFKKHKKYVTDDSGNYQLVSQWTNTDTVQVSDGITNGEHTLDETTEWDNTYDNDNTQPEGLTTLISKITSAFNNIKLLKKRNDITSITRESAGANPEVTCPNNVSTNLLAWKVARSGYYLVIAKHDFKVAFNGNYQNTLNLNGSYTTFRSQNGTNGGGGTDVQVAYIPTSETANCIYSTLQQSGASQIAEGVGIILVYLHE